jgi:hypothetical protein
VDCIVTKLSLDAASVSSRPELPLCSSPDADRLDQPFGQFIGPVSGSYQPQAVRTLASNVRYTYRTEDGPRNNNDFVGGARDPLEEGNIVLVGSNIDGEVSIPVSQKLECH